MYLFRFLGTFAIIPATLFLTMSFFVLFAAETIHAEGLKLFGYCVAGLLGVTAVLILFVGLFVLLTGRNPLRPVLKHLMRGQPNGAAR